MVLERIVGGGRDVDNFRISCLEGLFDGSCFSVGFPRTVYLNEPTLNSVAIVA